MTIEQEALKLVNEVRRERGGIALTGSFPNRRNCWLDESLCRALEQRDANVLRADIAECGLAAFKAEVSEKARKAVEALTNLISLARPHFSDAPQMLALAEAGDAHEALLTLILPTPDPLVEVLRDTPLIGPDTYEAIADEMRSTAERLGYTLKLERLDQ